MKTDDEKVFLRRTPQGFVPAYDRDVDLLSHIPVGAIVSTRPKRPRRIRRHRWWWALLNRVADSHPFYSRAEQVLTHLKMRTGWVDATTLVNGEDVQVIYTPRSISFDAMDETEFAQFIDRALDVVVHELLPGVDREELRREIEAMLGPEERKAA